MEGGNGELKRVGEEFIKQILDIQTAREEAGIHKRHNSIRYLTELLVRHTKFGFIKEEMINWREDIK